ncbi:hypothetical protein HY605_05040 [Candidatus Peregrinibacteria bacterium]|nr:hypothetical protein [Candidatus Peregrinibacteria bacterium]
MPINKELQKILLQAGLAEAEAALYLELLKSSAQNKWELVARTRLGKNKVYRAYDRLRSIKMVEKNSRGHHALPLSKLIEELQSSKKETNELIAKLKSLSPFTKIPFESVDSIEVAVTPEEITEQYLKMSEVRYETNLDFGDLEGLVPILGGIHIPFKFRANRFKQNAKNLAICTTDGPFTSCMTRALDMKKYRSIIKSLNIEFKGVKIVFSDTGEHVMFSYFQDPANPSAVTIKSPAVAAAQRLQFDQFYKNFKKF